LLPRSVVSVDAELELRVDVRIHTKPYTLTVTRTGFKLAPKGKRKGIQMPWAVFIEDDDAVLYSELQASIRKILAGER
jgi:hypothetical protein